MIDIQVIIDKIRHVATSEVVQVSFSPDEQKAVKDLYLTICQRHGIPAGNVRFKCLGCLRKRCSEMHPYLSEFEAKPIRKHQAVKKTPVKRK
jgi:hypothetical protein